MLRNVKSLGDLSTEEVTALVALVGERMNTVWPDDDWVGLSDEVDANLYKDERGNHVDIYNVVDGVTKTNSSFLVF